MVATGGWIEYCEGGREGGMGGQKGEAEGVKK